MSRALRVASVLSAAYLIVAVAPASAARSGRTFDETLACGAVTRFTLAAIATNPEAPAGVVIYAGPPLVGFDWNHSGITIAYGRCTKTAAVAFTSRGLPSVGVWGAGGRGYSSGDCTVPGGIVVRLRAFLNADGHVTSATLAIRARRHNRPIALLTFSPAKVHPWVTRSCA